MANKIEAYYFESEEFQNLENLKDVLKGIGEETNIRTPLERELRIFADERDLGWSKVLERESYNLDNNTTAEYLETDEGIFVISESNILYENSESIVSRSEEHSVNSG
jgi:hypothetical protein